MSDAAWQYEAAFSIREGAPVVRRAEIAGPMVSAPVKVCRTMRGAQFAAWRRNRGR